MSEEKLTLLTAKEAAGYLRVSLFTLGKMEKAGKIVPFRTPGGHRRYSVEMLNEYLENSRKPPKKGVLNRHRSRVRIKNSFDKLLQN